MEKYKVKSVKDLKKRIKNKEIVVNDKILLGLKYHGLYQTNIPRSCRRKVCAQAHRKPQARAGCPWRCL